MTVLLEIIPFTAIAHIKYLFLRECEISKSLKRNSMMNKTITSLILSALFLVYSPSLNAQEKKQAAAPKFHKEFTEHFNKPVSKFFNQNNGARRKSTQMRYIPATSSFCEKDTKVMMMRIDPTDPAGAGRGPEICSKNYTYYGSYSARIRIPEAKAVQPNVGAVVGYFTYNMERAKGLSEIDWEWLIADPEIVYIGTWTGKSNNLQRIGRIINLAEGKIYECVYHSRADGGKHHKLTGRQNQPETVPAIKDYNAAKRFYTYGFDWYPDRLVWWILHPETEERIVLWDYQGSTPDFSGIPDNKTRYLLNFWHTNNWPVHTNPKSIEKPKYPYEVEIDWMSYEPFDID